MNHNTHHQQGIALLSVMLICVIVALLASLMQQRSQQTIRHATESGYYDYAYQEGLNAEQQAIQYLLSGAERAPDHTLQAGLIRQETLDTDYGIIKWRLRDMQSLFNLNLLNASEAKTTNALAQCYLQRSTSIFLPVNAVIDWMDSNHEPRENGAESAYYQSLAMAYMAANRAMEREEELAFIRGISPNDAQEMLPFISILPVDARINRMTAHPHITQCTKQSANAPNDANNQASAGNDVLFTDKSSYFEVSSIITLGAYHFSMKSMLYLSGSMPVTILHRRFAPLLEHASYDG